MFEVRTRTLCAMTLLLLLSFAATSAFAQHTAKGQGNSDQPGTAGQQAAVDPKTGKVRTPTPEELQVLTESLKNNESTEGLAPRTLPNGTVAIDLQGRFESSMIAKKEADGTISRACVSNAKQAEAFLKGDKKKAEKDKKAATEELEVK